MLTSCKLTGDPKATANYHMGEENYYFSQAGSPESLASDGAPGTQDHVRIHGALSPSLGFSDGQAITREQFTNLLGGKDASGRKVAGWRRVHGIDLTFSAPKSVSVAALLTHRDPEILKAHEDAVLETMRELERESAAAQPKPGVCAPTGNLAYVTALDGFNRDHEPHIHTHVVVSNMTLYNGKVYALDGREIMTRGFNKVWGAMYRAKLAARLKELGYGVTYTKKGEFRLDAVSLEVEKAFSGRRAQILEAKERGLRDMAAWDSTRKGKDPEVAKSDVLAAWQKKLEQFQHKAPEVNRTEALAERQRWYKEAHWSVEARQELAGERETGEIGRWQLAAERATQSSACVREVEIITEYLSELGRTESWKTVTYSQAQQALQAQVQAGHILRTDNGFYTTWEMTRVDRECVQKHSAATSLVMLGVTARRGIETYQDAARRAGMKPLSERQAQVAAWILSAPEGTVVVQGDAGSGKTTMLRAVKQVAGDMRWQLAGVAVQGVAARNLEKESGIPSSTLASYLQDSAHRTANSAPRIIVLDEASMVGSRDTAKLIKVAARFGDKVVFVGDRHQIQSIGAGKPFERLVEAAEASGRLFCLSENWRQRDPILRDAVDLARQGQMRKSLDLLLSNKHVIEIPDAAMRRDLIATLYKKDTLIMTGTQASCDDLNKRIRETLIKKGELDRKSQKKCRLSWRDGDGISHAAHLRVAVGERIRFMENDYREGLDVRNGECGIVEDVSVATLTVRHDDGRRLKIDLNRYSAIDYGYAVTTYKGQGQTFSRVLVEADTRLPYLQDQRNSYVQITRARDAIKIFTDDDQALRDIAGILSGKRDTLELKAGIEEAKRMEAKLAELARNESTTLREAEDYGKTAAEATLRAAGAPLEPVVPSSPPMQAHQSDDPAPQGEAPQNPESQPVQASEPLDFSSHDSSVTPEPVNFKIPPSPPVHIKTERMLAWIGGDERLEAETLQQVKRIEVCINKKPDLAIEDKQVLAKFFATPVASCLLHEKTELAVLGAEVALGMRSAEAACSGLSKNGVSALEGCIGLATAVREEIGFSRQRDSGREYGGGLEL